MHSITTDLLVASGFFSVGSKLGSPGRADESACSPSLPLSKALSSHRGGCKGHEGVRSICLQFVQVAFE